MAAELDVIGAEEWGRLLGQSPYATPFHEYGWGQMSASQFGGKLDTYVAVDGQKQWLIPVFRDLPWQEDREAQTFTIGYGGPVAISHVEQDDSELARSVALLQKVQSELGLTTLKATLYPSTFWPVSSENPRITYGQTCKLDVADDTETIFDAVISGNARTAVRKAEKSGVVVHELSEGDDAKRDEALALLRNTQKSVGSSYQTDYRLFRAIDALNGPDLGSITYIAEVDTAIAGMAVCVFNRREMFHLFHGWDRDYAKSCANQALQWAMIQKAVALELSSYNMGESHTPEIAKAKLRWGGHPETVPRISL